MHTVKKKLTGKHSDDEFHRLATLTDDESHDPYTDGSRKSMSQDDIEMTHVGLGDAINTVTDLGVQNELERVDGRIDRLEHRVKRRGCCGPKRLALLVFILFVLLVVNFVLDFWHMILDTVERFEKY